MVQGLSILCVGTLKEPYWQQAAGEYCKRLGAFCRVQITEIAEERLTQNPSPAQIQTALCEEGKKILAKIPKGALVIAMCIEGKAFSSEELAAYLQKTAAEGGAGQVVFIIGGSHGLDDAVKSRANLNLSVSKMTFPHQLFRVMLLEQIYRAYQINGGGKYHK